VGYYNSQNKRATNSLATIKDKTSENSRRISAIRMLRNYNNHAQVEELLEVLNDRTDDIKIRITLAEALGWFNWSIKKSMIIDSLNNMFKDGTTPEELRREVLQSIKRLSVG
jgi:HEAT repeat protein